MNSVATLSHFCGRLQTVAKFRHANLMRSRLVLSPEPLLLLLPLYLHDNNSVTPSILLLCLSALALSIKEINPLTSVAIMLTYNQFACLRR